MIKLVEPTCHPVSLKRRSHHIGSIFYEVVFKFSESHNLFTTTDPPKYSNSNCPNLCFCLLKVNKKTFSLVQKIFSTNKNVFLSPFNKQKQRFGGLEFKYFVSKIRWFVVSKLVKLCDEFFIHQAPLLRKILNKFLWQNVQRW